MVDEVLAELATMATDGARPIRSGPKPALSGAELRKAIMAIWCHDTKGIVPVLRQLAGRSFQGPDVGDLLARRAPGQSRCSPRHHHSADRPRPQWRVHPGGERLDRGALPCLDRPLPSIGHHRRADGGAPRRVRRDRLRLRPHTASEATNHLRHSAHDVYQQTLNHRRLLEPIGNIPPAEADARYHAQLEDAAMAA